MAAYELMIKTNHYLIKDGVLTNGQKAKIVRHLLAARNSDLEIQNFYAKMKAGSGSYPSYFLPPYNDNKKYQTVIPMSPKTHILSMNAYEMDILRLLHLFAPEDPGVKEMVTGRIKHLANSCPGGDCMYGECFHSSVPTLRFFAVANSMDLTWMNRLVDKIHSGINQQYKGNALGYYWLCLSELPYDVAERGLLIYKDEILDKLKKSVPMKTERNKINQPVLYYVMRNCLIRFPEFEHIKNRHPYINAKDGRLHFDVEHEFETQLNIGDGYYQTKNDKLLT